MILKTSYLESGLFVDNKSLFIKEFLEDSAKVVLVTRPRSWGKSLDMLGRFLEIEVDAQGVTLQCVILINFMSLEGVKI